MSEGAGLTELWPLSLLPRAALTQSPLWPKSFGLSSASQGCICTHPLLPQWNSAAGPLSAPLRALSQPEPHHLPVVTHQV